MRAASTRGPQGRVDEKSARAFDFRPPRDERPCRPTARADWTSARKKCPRGCRWNARDLQNELAAPWRLDVRQEETPARAANPRGRQTHAGWTLPSGQALRGRGLVYVNRQAAAARTGWTNQERLGTTATETLEVLLPES